MLAARSLSARRAWIEIFSTLALGGWGRGSLSARRAWIEMHVLVFTNFLPVSLSARRAWIEM